MGDNVKRQIYYMLIIIFLIASACVVTTDKIGFILIAVLISTFFMYGKFIKREYLITGTATMVGSAVLHFFANDEYVILFPLINIFCVICFNFLFSKLLARYFRERLEIEKSREEIFNLYTKISWCSDFVNLVATLTTGILLLRLYKQGFESCIWNSLVLISLCVVVPLFIKFMSRRLCRRKIENLCETVQNQ